MITTEEDVTQSMIELAMYLSKQEDDVNVINIKGEAYTEDSED